MQQNHGNGNGTEASSTDRTIIPFVMTSEVQRQRSFVEGTTLIRQMTTRLKKYYNAQITELHNCVAAHYFNTFIKYHYGKGFSYKDVAAACLWVTIKMEETMDGSYCTVETILSNWYKVKYKEGGSLPEEFHEKLRSYFTDLERIVLLTNGFRFHFMLPHTYAMHTLKDCLGIDDSDAFMITTYWLCSDCIQHTLFGCDHSPVLIAAACTILASFWMGREEWKIPASLCRSFEESTNKRAPVIESVAVQEFEQTHGGTGSVVIDVEMAKYFATKLAQALCASVSECLLLKKAPKPINFGEIPFITPSQSQPAQSHPTFHWSGSTTTKSVGNSGSQGRNNTNKSAMMIGTGATPTSSNGSRKRGSNDTTMQQQMAACNDLKHRPSYPDYLTQQGFSVVIPSPMKKPRMSQNMN